MSSVVAASKQSTWRIFRVPALIAAVNGCGLVLALLTEGAIDVLWSAAVATPLFAVLWASFAAAKRKT